MAGVPMESASRYEQVLKDIRLTINDLVNEKFFKTFTELAHEQDIEVSHESIAPTFPADGLQHYQYADNPMERILAQFAYFTINPTTCSMP